MSGETRLISTIYGNHPTTPCGDDERSETFTHMAGWAVNVDLAACTLSPVS